MNLSNRQPSPKIALLLSDVDGTLISPDKVLTERTIAAVQALYKAGIKFAITSSRPPRGMKMFIEPLMLRAPLSACNGGVFVNPDLTLISQRSLAHPVVEKATALLEQFELDIWLYTASDWYVKARHGLHVDHQEVSVQFAPKMINDMQAMSEPVVKIVGVSDDHGRVKECGAAIQKALGDQVSATSSQPYYLDITDSRANKGEAVKMLSRHFSIDASAIATIGDAANDVLMFRQSGMSIAMGNAEPEVKEQAQYQTESNQNEGFAQAIENFVLAAVMRT